MTLNRRIQEVTPSQTLAIAAKAKELKQSGVEVVNFSAGEPDFDTPENIKLAAIKAINDGFTKYTAVPGIPELRDAICTKLKRDYKLDYKPTETIASNGVKHALFNALSVILDPGNEVLIPAPYWTSYPEMVRLAGGTPKIIKTTMAENFKLTPGHLANAVTKKTKAIIFNSPSNPTGAVYTKEELKELASVLKTGHVFILSDDVYDQLIYDNQSFTSLIHVEPSLRDKTIILNGVSKTYSMTGWRVGFAAGPEEIISAMSKFQGQTTSNVCSIAQKAAIEAFTGDQSFIKSNRELFQKRRDLMLDLLNKISNLKTFKPTGAFYIFANIDHYLSESHPTSVSIAEYLIENAKVAVVPGSAFGAEGYIRLSYACSEEEIKEGISRIQKAFADL